MPYITAEDRRVELDPLIERLADDLDAMGNVGGDLNYAISRLMARRVESVGLNYEGVSSTIKEAHEAECEFRRRIQSPYEDLKAQMNGDVYGDLPRQLLQLKLDYYTELERSHELSEGSVGSAGSESVSSIAADQGVPDKG